MLHRNMAFCCKEQEKYSNRTDPRCGSLIILLQRNIVHVLHRTRRHAAAVSHNTP
jgi:hypothetical protein